MKPLLRELRGILGTGLIWGAAVPVCTTTAAGQERPWPSPGTLVRVCAPSESPDTIQAHVLESTPTHLVLQVRSGDRVALEYDEIRSLQTAVKGRGGKSVLVGSGIGGAGGALLGLAVSGLGENRSTADQVLGIALVGLAGAGVGALLGWVVGAGAVDHWEPYPLDSVDRFLVSVEAGRPEGVRVRLGGRVSW